jgi:RimJ/RimL family protein N-acetyltransferase
MDLKLRNATIGDLFTLLAWRNSPEVRIYSKNREEITLDSHTNWLNQRILHLEIEPFWILEFHGSSVGYIRLDLDSGLEDIFLLSIAIDHNFRGKGIGTVAIQKVKECLKDFNKKGILARVHAENEISRLLFEKNGFNLVNTKSNFIEYLFIK